MSWLCPVCKREFKARNQPHSCIVLTLEAHFNGKPLYIREIFDRVVAILKRIGPYRISFLKNAIIVSARSSFLAVKPRKSYVDIEFLLDREIAEFPVHKTVRVSKNKVAHFVKIDSPVEVDQTIEKWLTQAYVMNIK